MKKNSHFQIDMKKLISIALLVIGIIGVQVSTNDLYGQTNRNKKHNNYELCQNVIQPAGQACE